MSDDRLSQLREELARQRQLKRVAPQAASPVRLVQGINAAQFAAQAPVSEAAMLPPVPKPSIRWGVLIAVPIVAAIVSISLLAYVLLTGQGSGFIAQPGQPQLGDQFAQAGPPQQFGQGGPPQDGSQQQAQAGPQAPAGPPPTVPGDDVLLTLIRSTLSALDQANWTGNYTVLRAIGAPGFQQANPPEKLANVFAGLRARNYDLSQVLIVQPKLYRKPEITPRGLLRISGFFPTDPERLNFDMIFAKGPRGRWRLFGLFADVAQPGAGQAAPGQTNPAASEARPAAPAAKPVAKTPAKPKADIRDRIDNIPAAPPQEAPPPAQDENFNPFGH